MEEPATDSVKPMTMPRRFQLSLGELLWITAWVSWGSYFVFMNSGGKYLDRYCGSPEHAEYMFNYEGGYRCLPAYLLAVPVLFLLFGRLVLRRVSKPWIRLVILSCLSVLPVWIILGATSHLFTRSYRCWEGAQIAACKTFATAEDTYCRVDYDGDGVLEYSMTLAGLYSSGNIVLIDRTFANAESASGLPKNGYVFKVLTMQGAGAPGGSKSYMKNGKMTEGYALIAKPKVWGETGWDSYQISREGTVYEKDLGKDTDKIFDSMNAFDPTGWYVSE